MNHHEGKPIAIASRSRLACMQPHRRQKSKTKRKIIIAIWSVAFAYLSLTSTEVDSADTTSEIGARNDVYPENEGYKRSVSVNHDGGVAHKRILRATGENETGESPTLVTNGLASSTLDSDPSLAIDFTTLVAPTDSSTDGQNGISTSSTPAATATTDNDLSPIVTELNCTPPAIDDFPRDLFTQAQRRQGYLAIHFLASFYIFYCIAIVCDEFFVPSIECICEELHLPSDVAGATFMAIGTSSPELFTNVIGTFITKGDIGVGTIVGSAVFNILGVCACCGIAAKTALPLEWYPLTRDCFFYSVSVILLIVFLGNRQVFWYEALALVLAYAVYIFVMYKNSAIKKCTESLVARISATLGYSGDQDHSNSSNADKRRVSFIAELAASTEKTPLLGSGRDLESEPPNTNWLGEDKNEDIPAEVLDEMLISSAMKKNQAQAEEEEAEWNLTQLPYEAGFLVCFQWVVTWPARFIFGFTVPDCREEKLRKLYPITFIMCIVWIALLSYMVGWLMTVIGHTLSIPDSVMGLTFLAAGTSVPEIVSSVIVARQGLGTMSISNSIGSNTFDILVCLGLPWLIRASMISSEPVNYIKINSGGLEYSAMTLLLSLVLLYAILACNRFYLDKKVGIIALILYCCFLVFASLFEMNVFFTVNLPTCDTDY